MPRSKSRLPKICLWNRILVVFGNARTIFAKRRGETRFGVKRQNSGASCGEYALSGRNALVAFTAG